jgi:cell division protein FtsZ
MTEMGKAMMGTGEASGEGRALMAAENAIQNPLLDEVTLKGAKAVLVNITGGEDMTLLEVDEAANAIASQVDLEANVIFGAAFDPTLEGKVRVSVVATGMDGASIAAIEAHAPRRAQPVADPRPEPDLAVEEAPAPIAEPEPVYASVRSPEPERARDLEPEDQTRPLFEDRPFPTPRFTAPPGPIVVRPRTLATQPDFGFDPPPARDALDLPEPVSDADSSDEPLFPAHAYGDDRRQKTGWLSMFGRPRPDSTGRVAAGRSGGAQLALEPLDDEEAHERDDLEIPSFLRRLAN